jgi:hypothetical protein
MRLPLIRSILAASALVATSPSAASAQKLAGAPPSSCDSILTKLAHGRNGYRPEGDHCEGLHAEQVSGGGRLRLIAFVRSDDAKLAKLTKLHISWPEAGADSIALQARSSHPYVFYAMTTVRPGHTGGYDWDLDRARAENLTALDFGFLAWLRQPGVPDSLKVYVPLQVSESSQAEPQGDYNVVVVSTANLKKVSVSVGELNADRTVARWVYRDQPLKMVSYPQDSRIIIPLPHVQGHLMKVAIGAQTTGNVPITLDFFAQSPSR